MTEDIITGLARFRELFVISRNSSFRYKGEAVDIKQVGRELGVRLVLEGSVRRSEDRLRVTAQLIDAITDEHLWAETYDRELTAANFFEVQDAITEQVVATLGGVHGKVAVSISDVVKTKNSDSLEAYEFYYTGMHLLNTEYSEVADRKMEQYFRRAIGRDPDFALGYVELGWYEMRAYWEGWSSRCASKLTASPEVWAESVGSRCEHRPGPQPTWRCVRLHGPAGTRHC